MQNLLYLNMDCILYYLFITLATNLTSEGAKTLHHIIRRLSGSINILFQSILLTYL